MPDARTHPLLARHFQALELFTARVHAVGAEQWRGPTPCTEWSVRDLVNHLTAEQLWAVPLVRDGAIVEAVGDAFDGDVLGPAPAASWDTAAAAAREAFAAPDALDRTVHLASGDAEAEDYCAQMITDLLVHAWDLSRAIGADEDLPPDLVAFAVREVTPYAADLEQTGHFAAPVPPPPDATIQTKLLSMLGRRP